MKIEMLIKYREKLELGEKWHTFHIAAYHEPNEYMKLSGAK